ncbi:T9SS type A sorting domain-containing protein [Tamlana fucoidanivorans]|uniref:T9SS type A sorting domain-containing protein n=1 Tax=Allotamlana fucoidanivorans TaxID=2583814 RepID=A0A5C4SG10_9FLAO|nr:T9SS type A sorting domain-containing protein [Tamlana fucoidanivorans]TNJ42551.1 T9SS type A sorting domain-containing protein [Tamlana fucoidanivorans]
MKKITFLLILAITSLSFSQNIPVDFESNITIGDNWKADSGLASVAVVDDPAASGKGKVGQINASDAGQPWQNAQLRMTTNYIDLTDATGSSSITFDYYSTVAGGGLLKLEQSLNGGGNVERAFTTSGTGWESITVDLDNPDVGDPVNDQYKLLVFFPGIGNGNGATNEVTYVDNISGVVGNPIAPTETTSVTVDFEPGGLGQDWSWTPTEVAPSFTLKTNPNPSGINTSDNVIEFIARTTDNNWALAFTDDIGQFTFDETNAIVKIMVHKPNTSKIAIKFEGLSPAHEIQIANTTTNQWEEVIFDFSGQIGNTYSRIVIIPDFIEPYVNGKDRPEDHTLYFDNIVVPEGTIVNLPEPTVVAQTPSHDETANQVISIFSDAYANVPDSNYNPAWGQSTSATIEMVSGEEVLKYASLNYQGTEYTKQNVSGLTHLHVDYWTANSTSLEFFLVTNNGAAAEFGYPLPITTTESWLGVDIPLSAFQGVDLAHAVAFKVVGNGTVWFDNFYFYNEVSLSTSTFTKDVLKVYPNPSKNVWTIKAKDLNITSVSLVNILGKTVLTKTPNSGEISIDASSLNTGLYFANIITSQGSQTIKLVKE